MAARDRHEIQVGLALIVSVIVLIAGLLWFQRYQFGQQHREVVAVFPTAGGLGAGDPVHVRGIPMGKVTRVELTPDGVRVSMDVMREVVLSDAAIFSVGSQGLIGERLVHLEPGKGKPIDDSSHVFQGSYEASVTEMVGQVEVLNQRLLAFLGRADSLLQDVQDKGGLGQVIEETTRAARTAADLLESNAKEISKASRTLAGAGEKLDRFLSENQDGLSKGVQGLADNAEKLDELLGRLQEVAAGADDVLTALQEQRGAAGRLIYDEQMGADVKESVERLKFLIDDILRNPERYLTVKIF